MNLIHNRYAIKTFLLSCLALTTVTAAASNRAENTIILDEIGVKNLRIETVPAQYVDFENTVFAIGRIEEIPASRSVVSTRIAGRIIELDVFEGDTVSKGQRIAKIESRQLGDPPPTIELFASQSGLVVSSHIWLGQPVEPTQEMMDITDRSTVWAVAQIPEREAAQVEVGSKARIRIPALGNQWLTAELLRFGLEADRKAGTVEGIFTLDNPDGRLRPGMRVEFSIILDQREAVLVIPREAVQGDPASRTVFTKDRELPNTFVRTPVSLGQQNDQFVEILSGLNDGDTVVTSGSYGLSFAGGGAGISLREALDAAHGHAHNEDGSEMTPAQRATHGSGHSHDHSHDHGDDHDHGGMLTWLLLGYAVIATFILVLVAQRYWNWKRQQGEASNA